MRQEKITRAAVPAEKQAAKFRAAVGLPRVDRGKGRKVQSVAVPSGDDDLSRVLRLASMRDAARKPMPSTRGFESEVVEVARHLVSVASVSIDGAEQAGADTDNAGAALAERGELLEAAGDYVGAAVDYARACVLGESAPCAAVEKSAHECGRWARNVARAGKSRHWRMLLESVRELLAVADEGERQADLPPIDLTGDNDTDCPPMLILDLPKVAPCDESSVMGVEVGPRGSAINCGALVSSVLVRSTRRLFRRRASRSPGGTILLDASGSMSIDADRLAKLAARIPAATIAFYSGGPPSLVNMRCGRPSHGALCIFARDGMRADVARPQFGGNSVDEYALQWLVNQPGPHCLVSDLHFCGGPMGQEWRARNLLDSHPGIRVIDSYWRLEEVLDAGEPLFIR